MQIIKFRYSVTFEVLLGILVLGAAAVLGITPPPQGRIDRAEDIVDGHAVLLLDRLNQITPR